MVWALLVLLLAIALIVMEMFVPSGGVLGILAAVAVVAAVVTAYYLSGPVRGTLFLAVTVCTVPAVIVLTFHWWPRTPLGRRMLIQPPSPEQVRPEAFRLRELIGRTGHARSKMLPSGAIVLDRRTYDAVSEGLAIEPGTPVRVVAVRGTHIVVRPVDAATESAQRPDGADSEAADLLARPIEEVVPDPFRDPLA